MFKNYVKIAIRNLLKYKGFSFINIFGLSIGIVCCILISLFVLDELSYDRYHEKADRIYRVGLRGVVGTNEFNGAVTSPPMAAAMVRDFPEVVTAARVRHFGFPVIRYAEKVFSEEKFFWTDPTFFEIFSIPFIQGNPQTALAKPNTVVITRSMAEKYFGKESAMGKILDADRRRDYLITGVVEDVPPNSHFHFDFLAALSTYEDSRTQNWLSNSYYTYFVLAGGASPAGIEARLRDLVIKYVGPQIQRAAGITLEQFIAGGGAYGFFIQPLTDIHLHSNIDHELEPNSDIAYVYIFTLIAIAILVIACINFMNLATARSARRAREVGIRKTVGSVRSQLIFQFLAESIFMSLISLLIALILIELLLPLFNNLARKQLDIDYLGSLSTIPLFLGMAVIVGLMAGVYPAFFLAGYKPVEVLKGSLRKGGKSPWLRSGLVIFQFVVSIILFIGTVIVYQQLEYIQNTKLGFNKEQMVVIQKTDDLGPQLEAFKQELLKLPAVVSASNTDTLPGENFNNNAHKMAGLSGEETHLLWSMRSDYHFADTYQVKMADGRFFSKDFSTDSSAVVLNQAAVKTLGLSDPLQKTLIEMGPTPDRSLAFQIIGVMKNFHFESLHQKIRPMVIKMFRKDRWGKYVTVRIRPENIKRTLSQLETTWHKFASAQPFEYLFFDRYFARIYDAEQRTGQVLGVFSILAICIACLGLFGLAAFTTEQRTKEIGIRKVLGASVPEIIVMLSKESIRWVLLANLIAWPAAYFAMHRWQQNFAYPSGIGIGTFILATLLSLVISLLAVSYQSVKAAVANPVNALKYE